MQIRHAHLFSHTNMTYMYSFTLPCKHNILIHSPMQTQYTHSIQPFMLSRTSTPTTIQLFMLSRATKNSPPPTNTHYYPAIHVEPDHQAPTTIQQFMLSRATNTHFYPAIHVEPDHQAPTTIQLFMLSWHTFTIFLIRSSYVLYVSNRLTQLRALLTVVILMC